jgi:uncharacterized protein (TIGR04141 family)
MKLVARLSKPNRIVTQLLKLAHGLQGPINNWAGIPGCSVYYGTAYSGVPSWVGFINQGTATPLPQTINSGSVALIFVPVTNHFICFSFGITSKYLDITGFERDFGLKVVLNSVDPGKLKSVDSKIIDTVIMNRRTQLNKENGIHDFGFEIDKDLLRGVAGKPSNSNFASSVAGSDTLAISCNVTTGSFLRKANEILAQYESVHYKTVFPWIDNVKPVKDQPLIDTLDNQLVTNFNNFLAGQPANQLQLASPGIIDLAKIDHFKYRGFRSRTPIPFPEFENMLHDMQQAGVATVTLQDLEHYNVEAIDGNNASFDSWPLYNWLNCEIVHAGTQYILSDGEWFEISGAYYTLVDTAFNRILCNAREYRKLGTTTAANERDYFSTYTVSTAEIILDQQLYRLQGQQNAIEICDIMTQQGEFIHVKDGGSSSKLSHLFNQGIVSGRMLLSEGKFRTDLRGKLTSKPQIRAIFAEPIAASDYKIVYRILKRGAIFTLPFFSKIMVNETRQKISTMGFKFKLEWVEKV